MYACGVCVIISSSYGNGEFLETVTFIKIRPLLYGWLVMYEYTVQITIQACSSSDSIWEVITVRNTIARRRKSQASCHTMFHTAFLGIHIMD